jgi:hypothetical protein
LQVGDGQSDLCFSLPSGERGKDAKWQGHERKFTPAEGIEVANQGDLSCPLLNDDLIANRQTQSDWWWDHGSFPLDHLIKAESAWENNSLPAICFATPSRPSPFPSTSLLLIANQHFLK